MNVRIMPREVGILNSRMDPCASTSRILAQDGLAARIGPGMTLECLSLPNLQCRKVSCFQTCVASGRTIVKRHDFGRRRRRFYLEEAYGAGIGESQLSSRCSRVRALEGAESDPLGPGYWDRAEGKKQMDEIEDMKELIAEAERLNKASQTDSATAEEREERARQAAAKLREELAKRAREQAEQRKTAEKMYQLGQTAYARGMYDKSVELFEAALTNVQGTTNLGGEIQIWLAMAYDANNRHDDCIALYKRLEARHPNKQIKRQAADLRYILEAPKLKISREEMVSIPIIERDYDKTARTYSQKLRDRRRPKKKVPQEKDYLEDWLVWDPPRWERNPYFWVALTVWLTLVGISLMFQD
ncbi:hypothetical protein Mapa_001310 [Marchantia paleacea]|nr:hypothetical protein Mapa_001310 [Marchantia paleacea]